MKVLVKIKIDTLMKRLDREASQAWGLNQAKADRAEERLRSLVTAHQDIAMRLVKLGHLSPTIMGV